MENTLDIITIKGLKYQGKHGFYLNERKSGNSFELDVIAKGNFKQAIKENNLDQTFNYELVSNVADNIFYGQSEYLIETLCCKIGDDLFNKAGSFVKVLTVKVRKLHPPIKTAADYAEIEMTWKRQ